MRRLILFGALALVAAPACGDLLDPAAAVVYGRKIPVEAVQEQLDRFVASRQFEQLAAQGDPGALKRTFEQERLSEIIMRAVLVPAAEERGIEITDADVQERIDAIVEAQFGGNVADLEEAMKEQGVTRPQFEDIIFDQLLNDALRADVTEGARPDPAELQEHYEEHEADYTFRRVQHILVEDQDLAAELASRLQAAPSGAVEDLFARLARQHSTDESSARRGGDLGFVSPGDLETLGEAVVRLEEGEVSDPVRSESGWHVIRFGATRVQSFEEVRPQLEEQLTGSAQDEAWREFLLALFEEADVEVNPRYGEFDEEQLQVVDPGAEDVPGAEEPEPDPGPSVPEIQVPAPPPPG
ncbi:MAG TPA: peptidylprolyl isomerase [Actinomycetota bacterium]|nr:peptidylprolyl isomerase [Actinomycetota bacterium]